MNHARAAGALLLCASTFLGVAVGVGAHAQGSKTANGLLVNAAGMTFYTFDMDSPGKSACAGTCASLWPPAKVTSDARSDPDYSIVIRDDGSRQWAYQGKPRYTYAMDKRAGDAIGDNFKEVWHVVR